MWKRIIFSDQFIVLAQDRDGNSTHTSHAASAKEVYLISVAQNLWRLCSRSYYKNTNHKSEMQK